MEHNEIMDKLSNLNINSETAEAIAEDYIQYLYFSTALEFALVVSFIFGLGFFALKLIKMSRTF